MTTEKMLTVLVCGGRDYTDRERVYRLLSFNRAKIAMIVQGAATGADTLACEWAIANKVPCLRVPAEWDRFGKKAGFIRNEKMLSLAKPDLVVAFPGGAGTAMMVRLAKNAGIRVSDGRGDRPRIEAAARARPWQHLPATDDGRSGRSGVRRGYSARTGLARCGLTARGEGGLAAAQPRPAFPSP
jgi:hypothetical protein